MNLFNNIDEIDLISLLNLDESEEMKAIVPPTSYDDETFWIDTDGDCVFYANGEVVCKVSNPSQYIVRQDGYISSIVLWAASEYYLNSRADAAAMAAGYPLPDDRFRTDRLNQRWLDEWLDIPEPAYDDLLDFNTEVERQTKTLSLQDREEIMTRFRAKKTSA